MSYRIESSGWLNKNIADFWNWYSSKPHHADQYFSKQSGEGLFRLLRLAGKLHGKYLDYGCGLGFLLHHMLTQDGLESYGLDFSSKSVDLTNQRFSGHSNWRGAIHCSSLPSAYENGMFDVITCIETIEHVTEEQLRPLFTELKRIIAPGGTILFTTPNNENFDLAMQYCPFCDTEFHNMQHLRSFSAESLSLLLKDNGFNIVFCKPINFMELMPRKTSLKDISFSLAYTLFRKWLRSIRYAVSPKTLANYFAMNPPRSTPHLCALCTVEVR